MPLPAIVASIAVTVAPMILGHNGPQSLLIIVMASLMLDRHWITRTLRHKQATVDRIMQQHRDGQITTSHAVHELANLLAETRGRI